MSENMLEYFNDDVSFDVAPNDNKIETVHLFGEKLLHVELGTAYGKKEIVCGRSEAIQNFVMLQGRGGSVVRFGVFASYSLCSDKNIKISLRHEDGICEEWSFDLSAPVFAASGEKTLFGTLMLSEQKA